MLAAAADVQCFLCCSTLQPTFTDEAERHDEDFNAIIFMVRQTLPTSFVLTLKGI